MKKSQDDVSETSDYVQVSFTQPTKFCRIPDSDIAAKKQPFFVLSKAALAMTKGGMIGSSSYGSVVRDRDFLKINT